MKKYRKQRTLHFQAATPRQFSSQEEMQPKDLVVYIRRAEKEVLHLLEKTQLSPAEAQFLLAQYMYVFITGKNRLPTESAMQSADTFLALWQEGLYVPSPEYPFTLEETLLDIEGGFKAKRDYSASFQAFTPLHKNQPRGIGHVYVGIVQHPETQLWQIWMITDGTCAYLGAYRGSSKAQRHLEEIIHAARRGGTEADVQALYKKLQSQGAENPKQLPFDMMAYLMEHLHLYAIKL